jgi:parallel beta-helix repeat protein
MGTSELFNGQHVRSASTMWVSEDQPDVDHGKSQDISNVVAENLAPNPSFENGETSPLEWSYYDYHDGTLYLWDNISSHTGSFSVGIANVSQPYNVYMWFTNKAITVDPTKSYIFSVWYKWIGAPAPQQDAEISVREYNENGTNIGGFGLVLTYYDDGDWHHGLLNCPSFSSSTVSVTLQLEHVYRQTVSNAYIRYDDVFFGQARVHNLNTGLNYTTIQKAIDAPETLDGHTIFVDKGIYYEHLVVKKSLSLIGERSSITIINGSGAYATIVHVIADNVSIGGFTIRNGQDYPGIYVENSSHCVIKGNTFIDINYYAIYTVNADYSLIKANDFSSSSGNWGRGIQLRYSDNSTITGNQIMTHNDQYCIWLHNSIGCNIYDNWLADAEDGLMIEHSYSCLVKKNVIENCERGIDIGWWVGGEFVENLIKSNYYGVEGEGSLPQYPQYPKWIFYHNNFINNTHQAYVSSGEGSWNNAGEGNYWDDYSGVDSNYDGIGDSPYSIEHAPNKDNHPLIGMFHSFNTSLGYTVNVISNSTIEDFQYFESNSTIRIHVSNTTSNQTFGFCRLSIPHALMDPNNIWIIIDGGQTEVLFADLSLYDNRTRRWIYFAYPHSTHEIMLGEDNVPPLIGNVHQQPREDSVYPDDKVEVYANVTDNLSGAKQVTLIYAFANSSGAWIMVMEMTNLEGNVWNATIPAFPYGTNVTYTITAEDNAGNTVSTEEIGYQYQYSVIPEFPSFLILPLLMIATLLAVIVYKKNRSKINKSSM